MTCGPYGMSAGDGDGFGDDGMIYGGCEVDRGLLLPGDIFCADYSETWAIYIGLIVGINANDRRSNSDAWTARSNVDSKGHDRGWRSCILFPYPVSYMRAWTYRRWWHLISSPNRRYSTASFPCTRVYGHSYGRSPPTYSPLSDGLTAAGPFAAPQHTQHTRHSHIKPHLRRRRPDQTRPDSTPYTRPYI